MSGSRCGDCGAPAQMVGPPGTGLVQQHFPDCITLREEAAGVEVRTTFSNQGRKCPRCNSEMTRNHDQQSDTWTWNCTGLMCGVTLDALPPIPGTELAWSGHAFREIARMPGAVTLEVLDDGTFVAPPGLVPASPDEGPSRQDVEADAIKELAQIYDRSMAGALELLRDAGLVLYNLPITDDRDWVKWAEKVMSRIDAFLPGGIP